MPDSSAVNVQLAERTESELQRVEREISLLQDRKLSLEAQLALVKPNLSLAINAEGERVLAPEDRLRVLQAQYASASAKYGPDHPDVKRLQREIAALKAQTGVSGRGDTANELKKLEAELAALGRGLGSTVEELREAEAADRIALHLARVIERAIESLGEKHRVQRGVELARAVLARVDELAGRVDASADAPVETAGVLRAVLGRRPDGSVAKIESPLIPLLDTLRREGVIEG